MVGLGSFCFFAVIFSVNSAIAPFIKPCKSGDKECILASAQAVVPYLAPGIPELAIPSVDPLKLAEIIGDGDGLKLKFTDTVVTGMKGCNVDWVKHDLKKKKQAVAIRCSVNLKGNYKLGGQLLILPIRGEGKYNIDIRDIVIKAYTNLTTVDGVDGKPHWHIKSWRHTYDVKTSTTFDFENLFNGNKVLADPVNQFVNNSWREVMQEIAPPIVKPIVKSVVESVEALYKAVPADELFTS